MTTINDVFIDSHIIQLINKKINFLDQYSFMSTCKAFNKNINKKIKHYNKIFKKYDSENYTIMVKLLIYYNLNVKTAYATYWINLNKIARLNTFNNYCYYGVGNYCDAFIGVRSNKQLSCNIIPGYHSDIDADKQIKKCIKFNINTSIEYEPPYVWIHPKSRLERLYNYNTSFRIYFPIKYYDDLKSNKIIIQVKALIDTFDIHNKLKMINVERCYLLDDIDNHNHPLLK